MQALCGSKGQKSSLRHFLYTINEFAICLWSLLVFKQLNVFLRVKNIRKTPASKERMRPGPHTDVRKILPVRQVMTALVPRQCPVRDFVVLITLCLQTFVGIFIHICA